MEFHAEDGGAVQIGLKLDAAKVPMGMIVIDHVERVPREN